MRYVVVALSLLLTGGAVAQIPGHDPADCYCRAAGRMFAVGQNVCLRTPDGPRLARCDMVLNVTSWIFSEIPCLDS